MEEEASITKVWYLLMIFSPGTDPDFLKGGSKYRCGPAFKQGVWGTGPYKLSMVLANFVLNTEIMHNV